MQSSVKESQPTILFFTSDFNGLGDLSFSMKVCAALKEKYAHANIVLVTDAKTIPTIEKVFKKESQGITLLPSETFYSDDSEEVIEKLTQANIPVIRQNQKAVIKPALLVEGPVFQTFKSVVNSTLDPDKTIPMTFATDTPVMLIPEYDFPSRQVLPKNLTFTNVTELTTGFAKAPKEGGILIDKELARFADSSEENKTKEKVNVFTHLNNKYGLLDSDTDCTIDEYLGLTDFAFGYHPEMLLYHHAATLMVAAALTNIKDNENNLDHLVIGKNKERIKDALHDETLLAHLQKQGFKRISFVDLDLNTEEEWVTPDEDVNLFGKELRILYKAEMDHEDMPELSKLSYVAGDTGNQSISENLSAGVFPIYSVMPFNQTFCASLQDYYKKYSDVISTLFANFSSNGYIQDKNNYYASLAKYARFLWKNIDKVNSVQKILRDECNLYPKIFSHVDSALSKQKESVYEQNAVLFLSAKEDVSSKQQGIEVNTEIKPIKKDV